jgi:hypothetical protein
MQVMAWSTTDTAGHSERSEESIFNRLAKIAEDYAQSGEILSGAAGGR